MLINVTLILLSMSFERAYKNGVECHKANKSILDSNIIFYKYYLEKQKLRAYHMNEAMKALEDEIFGKGKPKNLLIVCAKCDFSEPIIANRCEKNLGEK